MKKTPTSTRMTNINQLKDEWEKEYEALFPMPPYFVPTLDEPIYDLDKRKQSIKAFISTLIDKVAAAAREEQKQFDLGELGDRNSAHDTGFQAGAAAERERILAALPKTASDYFTGEADARVDEILAYIRTLIQNKSEGCCEKCKREKDSDYWHGDTPVYDCIKDDCPCHA